MEEFKCEYCSKQFATKYSLDNHKKTAKFCMEIQKKNFNIETINLYVCDHCNKPLGNKLKLQQHLSICKMKLEYDIKELMSSKKESEFKDILSKKESEFKDTLFEKELEIRELSIKYELYKERTDHIINELKEQIENYKIQLVSSNSTTDKLINKVGSTNVYNGNTNYNIQYNQMFEKIEIKSTPNVIDTFVKGYNHIGLYNSVDNIDEYFINQFVNNFTKFTFTTDAARGILVIKKEDGKSDRIHAEEFVLDCLKIGQETFIKLFARLDEYINMQNEIGVLDDIEYIKMLEKVAQLKKFIYDKKTNSIVKKTAMSLVKNTKKLQAKNSKVLLNEISNN
jgi:hypothetical protein